jgi:hypothetical protein
MEPDTLYPLDARVDAGVDGSPGCTVPEEPIVIQSPTEPCFVTETARTPFGDYLMGGAQGWQQIQASLWLLSGDDLSTVDTLAVGAEMAFPACAPTGNEAWAVTESDNQVILMEYRVTGSTIEQAPGSEPQLICNDCAPAWQSPVITSDRVALAVRFFGENQLQVISRERSTSGFTLSPFVIGRSPKLVAMSDGLALFYRADEQAWLWRLDENAQPLAEPVALELSPVIDVVGAASEGGDHAWVGALLSDGLQSELMFGRVQSDGELDTWASFSGLMDYGLYTSMTFSRGMLGVSWGVTYGEGRVGAHFLAMNASAPEVVADPVLVSPPVGRSSVSHTVWSSIAPHPQGFAVIWGGWNEQTYHGQYGKILSCHP